MEYIRGELVVGLNIVGGLGKKSRINNHSKTLLCPSSFLKLFWQQGGDLSNFYRLSLVYPNWRNLGRRRCVIGKKFHRDHVEFEKLVSHPSTGDRKASGAPHEQLE